MKVQAIAHFLQDIKTYYQMPWSFSSDHGTLMTVCLEGLAFQIFSIHVKYMADSRKTLLILQNNEIQLHLCHKYSRGTSSNNLSAWPWAQSNALCEWTCNLPRYWGDGLVFIFDCIKGNLMPLFKKIGDHFIRLSSNTNSIIMV